MQIFNYDYQIQTTFLEIKVWEKMLQDMVIANIDQSNPELLLKIDTYEGILRECINLNIVNLTDFNNIYFETYVQYLRRGWRNDSWLSQRQNSPYAQTNKKKNSLLSFPFTSFQNLSIFQSFNPLKIEDAFNLSLSIRIRCFECPSVFNENVVLGHVMNSYYHERRDKLKNLAYKDKDHDAQNYEFIQADFQDIVLYC